MLFIAVGPIVIELLGRFPRAAFAYNGGIDSSMSFLSPNQQQAKPCGCRRSIPSAAVFRTLQRPGSQEALPELAP
jgi:hypothetical protein